MVLADRADEALAPARAAVALSPNNPRFRTRLGSALWRSGRPDEALEAYIVAFQTDSLSYDATNHFPTVALQLPKHRARIISLLRQDADRNRDFVLPLIRAADALSHLGESEAAVEYVELAHDLAPDDLFVASSRAEILDGAGRHEEAETALRQVVAAMPGDANAWYGLGLLLLGQGRPREAADALEKAIELRCPRRGYVERELAFCWIQFHAEKRLVALGNSLPETHANAVAHMYWGAAEWHYESGRPDEALRLMEKAESEAPSYASVRAFKVAPLLALHRYEEAKALCRTFVGVAFEYHGALAHRGVGEFDRAHALAQRFSEYTRWLLAPRGHARSGYDIGQRAAFLETECAELRKRAPDLDRIAAFQDPAPTAQDAVWNARLCYWKGRYGAAAKWFVEAFRREPELADDFIAQHRYWAAWAAAKAERWDLAERWVAEERKVWEAKPLHRGYREMGFLTPRRWMIERVLAGREK